MQTLSRRQSILVALIVAGAFFMEYIDSTVIATALPMMAATFEIDPVALSIGMTAYLLTLAAFIPMSGWVADRFGSRTVFCAAVSVFTLASVLCGISNGVETFIAARVLQGIGGAMMVPVGRFVVLRTTEKKDLINAQALLTWPALAAPILGPPVGGFIATYWSWRWIFMINVPLGLVALVAAWWIMPNLSADRRRPFDGTGFILTGIALTGVMYGLDRFAAAALCDSRPLIALVLGLGFGGLALRHLRHATTPLVDLWPIRGHDTKVFIAYHSPEHRRNYAASRETARRRGRNPSAGTESAPQT